MRAARAVPAAPDLVLPFAGALLTVFAAFAAASVGPPLVLLALASLLAFSAAVLGFVAAPHVAVAVTIPLFAALPTLKVVLVPWIGPLKDGVVVAAVVAALIVTVRRSVTRAPHTADGWVVLAVGLLMTLYLFNLGGGLNASSYDLAWLQGVRLTYEPLLLLLVGLTLDTPRRTFRWAACSMVATASAVALYGVVQQLVGDVRLVTLGYEYDVQVRFFEGQLRSFGSLDDPFTYAAFLLFGLGVVFSWRRAHPAIVAAAFVIAAGLTVAYVRTAAIVAAALLGVWLASRRRVGAAVALLLSAAVVSVIILFTTEGATQARTVVGRPGYVTLNGRTEAWNVAVGDDPIEVLFGQGVGEIGTAAARARYSLTRSADEADERSLEAVDSGYFATVSDVGFIGLAVLLLLYGRLFALAVIAARRGLYQGWVAASLLVVLALDATTRDSFAGFPTAFVGLLLVGNVLAATREQLLQEAGEPARA
jgi:hypothetical protein